MALKGLNKVVIISDDITNKIVLKDCIEIHHRFNNYYYFFFFSPGILTFTYRGQLAIVKVLTDIRFPDKTLNIHYMNTDGTINNGKLLLYGCCSNVWMLKMGLFYCGGFGGAHRPTCSTASTLCLKGHGQGITLRPCLVHPLI